MLNYVGSVFFMASAIASFTLTTTGEAINIAIVNSGTFLGAICFLVGSYVLLPPARPTGRLTWRRRRDADSSPLDVSLRERLRYRFDNVLARGRPRRCSGSAPSRSWRCC